MSTTRKARSVAAANRLPLVQLVVDLRFCDPPGEKVDFSGPLPAGTESILRTMLTDVIRLHRAVKDEHEAGR